MLLLKCQCTNGYSKLGFCLSCFSCLFYVNSCGKVDEIRNQKVSGNVSSALDAGAFNKNLGSSQLEISSFGPGYGNISVTYDTKNAVVNDGMLISNAETKQVFAIRVGLPFDKKPSSSVCLDIRSEYGQVSYTTVRDGNDKNKNMVEENGYTDADGIGKFSLEFLNTKGLRPYRVRSNDSPICDPRSFSTPVDYAEISKNWRSTVAFSMKGHEQFNDSNNNGILDAGGAGFWDKNQNGIFDATDVITTGHTSVEPQSEWFIDLPTPFIDSNENGRWDPWEITFGKEYMAPNGHWDGKTDIWKSFVVPVYLGASPYSLTHSTLSKAQADEWCDAGPSRALSEYLANAKSPAFFPGVRSALPSCSTPTDQRDNVFLFDAEQVVYPLYFLAQDLCGGPLPGGTKITIQQEDISGNRSIAAHFYLQPNDRLLESARRLTTLAKGSEVIMNFHTIDHPAAAANYPIQFFLEATPCTTVCSGAVKEDSGFYCGETFKKIILSVENTADVSLGYAHLSEVDSCRYLKDATCKSGICSCPVGKVPDALSTACVSAASPTPLP